MKLYSDILSHDPLFDDSFTINLVDNFYYEVEGINASGVNLETKFSLVETKFDEDAFERWSNSYMKNLKRKVVGKDENSASAFRKAMPLFTKYVLDTFDNWKFYLAERKDPDGMVILQRYKDDTKTPVFIFFKYGLEEEKS